MNLRESKRVERWAEVELELAGEARADMLDALVEAI